MGDASFVDLGSPCLHWPEQAQGLQAMEAATLSGYALGAEG